MAHYKVGDRVQARGDSPYREYGAGVVVDVLDAPAMVDVAWDAPRDTFKNHWQPIEALELAPS